MRPLIAGMKLEMERLCVSITKWGHNTVAVPDAYMRLQMVTVEKCYANHSYITVEKTSAENVRKKFDPK